MVWFFPFFRFSFLLAVVLFEQEFLIWNCKYIRARSTEYNCDATSKSMVCSMLSSVSQWANGECACICVCSAHNMLATRSDAQIPNDKSVVYQLLWNVRCQSDGATAVYVSFFLLLCTTPHGTRDELEQCVHALRRTRTCYKFFGRCFFFDIYLSCLDYVSCLTVLWYSTFFSFFLGCHAPRLLYERANAKGFLSGN